MGPTAYDRCLGLLEDTLSVGRDLHRVNANEIIAMESELDVTLPEQYESFLMELGAGEELDGLGFWYHCDLTRPGNLLTANMSLWKGTYELCDSSTPKDFLAIYDCRDGAVVGFRINENRFCADGVVVWGPEGLETVGEDFNSFLRANLDLPPEVIDAVEDNVGETASRA